jgi:hypothetical protein
VSIPPERLRQEEGPLDFPLEVIADALPDTGPELLGLRDGGWEFTRASAMYDGGLHSADGTPLADTLVSFQKSFELTASRTSVAADARACGVTEWSTPQFSWEDPHPDEDYDGFWDLTGN